MGKQCSSASKTNLDSKSAKKGKKGKNSKQSKNGEIMSGMDHQTTMGTAGRSDTDAQFKFLTEDDNPNETIDDVNKFFLKQIFQMGLTDYINEDGSMYLSYELLMTISKAQMATVERLLETIHNDDQ